MSGQRARPHHGAARATTLAARAVVIACCLWTSSSALAQPAAPKDAQSAITLGREAKEHYDRGDWKTALELFKAAEGRTHSPVLLLYIARCQRNLGQLMAARGSYLSLSSETLAADAPEPFRLAKEDGAKDLAALEPRIPRIQIQSSGLPAGATVELDGRALGAGDLSGPLLVDPGAHTARALQAGKEIASAEAQLGEGESKTLTLAHVATAVEPPGGGKEPAPTAASRDVTLDVLGTIALVLGSGGLAAGVATRVMAHSIVDDVRSRCIGNVCSAEDEDDIDQAKQLQTGSTIALVVGGALAATGITLLVVSTTSGPTTTALTITPRGLRFSGNF